MSKAKKITAIVFACLFAAIAIFLLSWYFGDTYGQFYKIAKKEFEIPGLSESFTPQGMCYEQTSDIFLISGYMSNKKPSRVYVVDAKTQKATKFFTLKNIDGSEYLGHSGGIETDGTSVWLVGDGTVLRFNFLDIESTENSASIQIVDKFESKNGADFVTRQGNYLWIGEFHREGKYDTDKSHEIETKDGTNKAISFCYEIDSASTNGLKSTTPIKALSTGSLVQGMAITDDSIILSTSYSLANAHIKIYSNILEAPTKTFQYDEETQVDLVVLDSDSLLDSITTPSMSEEIAIRDGRLYVLFENACKKYGLYTREPLKNTYSFEI